MLELTVLLAIMLILAFEFINGFHDSANAIATIVATKVLMPIQAVSMAAVGNLIGPLFFGVAIAKMVGTGIVDTNIVTTHLILAAVIGAIVWDLLTWYWGLPVSSSHALIGGLVGAAVASGGSKSIIFLGVFKVVIFMVIAPILGLIGAFTLAGLVLRTLHKVPQGTINKYFRKLQLVSAFFYSVTHGTNDAQKGMGLITLVLFSAGGILKFEVPPLVILAAAASLSLGTLFGGWRIVKTMAHKITELKPWQGFCAETAGAMTLVGTAIVGIPVSTTHVIAGSIAGVGATKHGRAVKWGMAKKIVWAWILTIPASALVSWAIYLLVKAAVAVI